MRLCRNSQPRMCFFNFFFALRNIFQKNGLLCLQRLFEEIRYWSPFSGQVGQFPRVYAIAARLLPRSKAMERPEKPDYRCSNRSIYSRGNGQAAVGRRLSNIIFVNCEIQSCGPSEFYLCYVGSRLDLRMRISSVPAVDPRDLRYCHIASSAHRVQLLQISKNDRLWDEQKRSGMSNMNDSGAEVVFLKDTIFLRHKINHVTIFQLCVSILCIEKKKKYF